MTMMSFEVEKQSPEKVAQSFFESFISKEENQAAVKSGEGIAGQNLLAEVSESVNENAQKYGRPFAELLATFFIGELDSKEFLNNYDFVKYNPDADKEKITRAAKFFLEEYIETSKETN